MDRSLISGTFWSVEVCGTTGTGELLVGRAGTRLLITLTDGPEEAKRIELVGVWLGSDDCDMCP